MDEIKIVFSQKLNIEPTEFVAVWNDTPECRDIAKAQLVQLAKTQYADPVSVAIGFGSAIASGILYDGVKICVSKMKKKIIPLIYNKDIRQKDGSVVTKVLPEKNDTSLSEKDDNSSST
jgi:hypothetical protein